MQGSALVGCVAIGARLKTHEFKGAKTLASIFKKDYITPEIYHGGNPISYLTITR